MGRAILHYVGRIATATACGYLGLLGCTALLGLPLLAASAISGSGSYQVFASGGLVRILGRPLGDVPAGIQALYLLGPAVLAALALAVGPFVARRANGWLGIAALHLVFWCGVAFSESALAAAWGRGPLGGLARYLGVSGIGSVNLQIPLAVLAGLFAGGMVYRCALYAAGGRGSLPCLGEAQPNRAVADDEQVDGEIKTALFPARLRFGLGTSSRKLARFKNWGSHRAWEIGWRLVIPVAVLALLLPPQRIDPWQRLLGVPFAPVVFAGCIAVLAVIRRNGTASPVLLPAATGSSYAIGLAGAVAALTLALPDWNSPPAEHPATELRASAHWELQFEKGGTPAADRAALLEAADRRVAAAAGRLGIPVPSRRLRAIVRTTEDRQSWIRGRRRGEGRRGDANSGPVEYRLMPSGELPDARIEPRVLMAATWGEAGYEPLANAIARFATGDFLGYPLGEYARRIACEEGAYDLAEVLDLRNEYLSPIVRDALGGAWIESLGASAGTLKRIYSFRLTPGNSSELAVELGAAWDRLEASWKEFLTADADCAALPADPPLPRIAWHKGISFSHEVGGGWGYGSDSAAAQLDRIRSIGANSAAIIPYAFSRAPEAASISFRTDETDERVIRTIEQARAAGLAAVLKPQIWARQFTGNIKFSSRDEFDIWFAQYRRWLLHFARLGALHRAEMLVIGTELGGMTGYEDAWRGLIADVRAIYAGELAYAANWDQEFEAVKFWDALDYVSVNFYFPLTDGEGVKPSAARLEELAGMVESVASRYGKRVIFTEVGYPSLATAARRPWEETAAALDHGLQRECYEAVFRAFVDRPWFAGFYWWKWPSHGTGGVFDESFSPLGKPALEELTKWYRAEHGPGRNREAPAPAAESPGADEK